MKPKVLLYTALLSVGLLFLILIVAVQGYELWAAGRIYPGVHVWGVHVGGMRLAEAAAALGEALGEGDRVMLTLRGPERSWQASPVNLGFRLDAGATAQQAFRVGRGRGEGLLDHLHLLLAGQNIAPVLVYDESVARLYLAALRGQIDREAVDAALRLEGGVLVATPSQMGRVLDVEATLAALPDALAGGNMTVDLVLRPLPPRVTDAGPARAQAQALIAEPFVILHPSPREGDPGPWTLSPQELLSMLAIVPAGERIEVGLDATLLRAYVENIAPSLEMEAVDARFHFDPARGQLVAIAPSSDGRAVDVEASVQNILSAAEAGRHVAPLALVVVPPRYPDTATAEETGITALVGEGSSYFFGSPSGRDHNIRLAAARFDGLVIPPGETFSFNHYLGEVSAEAGYDESLITTGEQLQMGIGGGICQVSTTAFRAALDGGYPIVERWYHYQRVGYYEWPPYGPGFDATVYSPYLDFRFTNDRAAPLLIETVVDDAAHTLTFRFYSSDDGRRVVVEGPAVSDPTEPNPPLYQLDAALEPGTVREWQSAMGGLTAVVERWVYDAAGNLLYHDVFTSRYAPRRAVYHYGPGYEPP